MSKILGLDLGTNSIGWAVIEKDANDVSLKEKGVHIFSEGVKIEKGVEISKAAERTRYRSARKIKFRRKLRKIETLKVLIENDMCPLTKEELDEWIKNKKAYPASKEFRKWLATDEATGINPYFLRDKASRQQISSLEYGRAFYHLSQRRGFLSNRLDQSNDEAIVDIRKELLNQIEFENSKDDLIASLELMVENFRSEDLDDKAVKNFINKFSKVLFKVKEKSFEELKAELQAFLNRKENLGAVKKGIADLTELIKESGCETLGQYFHQVYQRKGKIRKNYTAREEHYLAEFKKICEVQKLSSTLIAELEDAIFFQRKLKSQRGLVGKCSFEKTKPRCPVSHPAFEEFRALQFINSIKAEDEKGKMQFLTAEERTEIFPKFLRKSKPTFDFSEIASALTPKGTSRKFNYKNNVTVTGCPTSAQLAGIFGVAWKNSIFSSYNKEQFPIRKRKKKSSHSYERAETIRNKSVDEIINEVWHALFSFDKEENLLAFAKSKLNLDDKQSGRFAKIILKKEYAALSLKAINKILPLLREGCIYSYAAFLANVEEVVGKEIWSRKENQDFIRSEIKKLIDNFNEQKKRESIVNDVIAHFKKEFNNSHRDYVLDESDKKEIRKRTHESFGKNYFESLPEQQQNETVQWIENKTQEQLRRYRGEFIKTKRLDDVIEDFFIKNFNSDRKALSKLYHPSDIEKFKKPERNREDGKLYLLSPVIPSIKNPMAMRTMHRLRKLINTLIREDIIDEETNIHIELARELNDANKRKAIQDYQKERESQRAFFKEKIKELYKKETRSDIEPTDNDVLKFQVWLEQDPHHIPPVTNQDILKYELWDEQNHICLYTGKRIRISDFIGANPKFDIEHTIPRSISSDNSQENKTLADIKFNRETKANKIPFELANHEEILSRIAKWKEKIEELEKLYNSRKKPRGIETKEQKDKRIRQKHYYKLLLDYWQGKYNRFIIKDVTKGFKNSQIIDTGIITKYAKEYLKSIFDKVYSVKGEMTAEFRKIWGLQDEYKQKERINHVHHTIDAITVACMTKDKYDLLAASYMADEENQKQEAKNILSRSKPWQTFTEDLKAIEQQILVSHHTPDNMRKHSKKKVRVRGKIKYDKNNNPVYQKGDTARASLHMDTFYGAILTNEVDKKTRLAQKDEDGNDKKIIRYVVRKELSKLKESDIDNIVDPVVKEKLKEAVAVFGFKKAMAETIWLNKEKNVPIIKVRVFAPSVTDPLEIKEHSHKSKQSHKQKYYAQNDGNYLIALYETTNDKGKTISGFEIINNRDAALLLKESSSFTSKKEGLFPVSKELISNNKTFLAPLKFTIKRGTHVLFYQENGDEIWNLKANEITYRMYRVVKFDKSGRIYFRPHSEARPASELKEQYVLKYDRHIEQIPISIRNLKALIEGKDFILSITGSIRKVNAETNTLLQ